eukprot:7880821-Alexandrium_andersonii.AAC.1
MECINLFHLLRERLQSVGAANCGFWKSMKANTTAGAPLAFGGLDPERLRLAAETCGCPAGAGGGASAACRNGGRRCAWGGLAGGAARAAPAVREEGWCC